jgi:putative oxidoreductase
LALLGAGFCIVTALLYHFQPADQMQMTMAFKNFAIAGGLLYVFAFGAGTMAIDKN